MDKGNGKIRRVCVIGNRSGKGGRDRLSGILRYSAQTPNWILDVILVEMRDAASRLASTLVNTPPDAVVLLTTERRILSVLADATKTTLCRTYGVKSIVERNSTVDLRGGGRLITTACEYMRNHANEHINVDQIAAYCRVSRRLLEIRAREILGKSVREHIESVRMNNVRNLLSETRIPLQEIAFRTGFKTQAYLAARFKTLFGCSMRDYRNSASDRRNARG